MKDENKNTECLSDEDRIKNYFRLLWSSLGWAMLEMVDDKFIMVKNGDASKCKFCDAETDKEPLDNPNNVDHRDNCPYMIASTAWLGAKNVFSKFFGEDLLDDELLECLRKK